MGDIKIRLRLIIIKNEKLLTTYDSKDDYYFYMGGKMEFGETVIETCTREVKEECGENVNFEFKKILYIRDFLPDKDNHSLELFVLGEINQFEELEHKVDTEFEKEHKWLTWVDINELPDNLYPKALSTKLVADYKAGFPASGEYVGRLG